MNQLICFECHKRIDMNLTYHPSPQNPKNRICDFCYYKDHLDQLADQVYKLLKSVDINDRMRILKLLTFYDKQINQITSDFLKAQHRQIYHSLIISTQPDGKRTAEKTKPLPDVEIPDVKYWCPNCNYQTNKKSSYQDHLKSKKHLKNTGSTEIKPRKERSDKGTKKKVLIVGRVTPEIPPLVPRIPTPPLNEPWGETPESINFETPEVPKTPKTPETPENCEQIVQQNDSESEDSEQIVQQNDDSESEFEESEAFEDSDISEMEESPMNYFEPEDSEEPEASEELEASEDSEALLSMDSELAAILQSSDEENQIVQAPVIWKILPNPDHQPIIEIRPSTPPLFHRRSLHPSPIKITMASLPPPQPIPPKVAPQPLPPKVAPQPLPPKVAPNTSHKVAPQPLPSNTPNTSPKVAPSTSIPPTPSQIPTPVPTLSKELPLNIIKQYPSHRLPDFSISDTLEVLTYRSKDLSSQRYLNLQNQEKQLVDRILASLLNHATHPNHFKRIYQYIITKGTPNAIQDRLAQLFYELDQNLSKNPKSNWAPIHPIIKRFTTYYCANGQLKKRQFQRR